ncbi:hypothetical protein IEO21_08099 [Rhodonia placenta]|uniref:AB hydrolase-1 domain-containing protein n=1 Tax=Rhodonia placenta TaxID=104341 RepID=A0A8H7NWT1_9APHY|nr:hypothetical protein IEO21_08099 [Postia placenta]
MPHAPIVDTGVQLYYEDSGAPAGSQAYVTLVLVHGSVFHTPIYRPMFKYAAEHDMRLVAVTLRDYPGSTPFTPEEHAALRSPDKEIQAAMIRDRGHELASFLAWFVRKESIPPMTISSSGNGIEETVAGGLALLGWSWGNCMTMSLVAHADSLPAETKELLEPYMRTLVAYDPPYTVFGAPHPTLEEIYAPHRDPNYVKTPAIDAFEKMVSAYYTHSPTILSNIASITREKFFAGLSPHSGAGLVCDIESTIQRMSADEIAATTDISVMERSQKAFFHVDFSINVDNTRRALHEKVAWPHMRAILLWCDKSLAECVYAAWYAHKMLDESWPKDGRRFSITRMEGVNHFVSLWGFDSGRGDAQRLLQPHWDQPQTTVEALSKAI